MFRVARIGPRYNWDCRGSWCGRNVVAPREGVAEYVHVHVVRFAAGPRAAAHRGSVEASSMYHPTTNGTRNSGG